MRETVFIVRQSQRVDTPGLAVDLAVGDTMVYMADSSEGLRIIDISIPSLPSLRGVSSDTTGLQFLSQKFSLAPSGSSPHG